MEKKFSDYSIFEKNLNVLKKYLRPQKITILGGEPLLHPDIDYIIRIAKESGMFEEIHITTNGTNINKMSDYFWQTIDKVIISQYPCNEIYIKNIINAIKERCNKNDAKLEIRDMRNFKHIVLSEKNNSEKIVKEVFDKCIYKYYCHTLGDDKIFRCSPVVNFSKYKNRKGFVSYSGNKDYLEIKDTRKFKKDLYAYLNSNRPLEGCNFCLGTSGKTFSHRQLTKDEIENPDMIKITAQENYDLSERN